VTTSIGGRSITGFWGEVTRPLPPVCLGNRLSPRRARAVAVGSWMVPPYMLPKKSMTAAHIYARWHGILGGAIPPRLTPEGSLSTALGKVGFGSGGSGLPGGLDRPSYVLSLLRKVTLLLRRASAGFLAHAPTH